MEGQDAAHVILSNGAKDASHHRDNREPKEKLLMREGT
jgi:hypothetical protein